MWCNSRPEDDLREGVNQLQYTPQFACLSRKVFKRLILIMASSGRWYQKSSELHGCGGVGSVK